MVTDFWELSEVWLYGAQYVGQMLASDDAKSMRGVREASQGVFRAKERRAGE